MELFFIGKARENSVLKNSSVKDFLKVRNKLRKERVIITATIYTHVQLGVVDKDGNLTVMYPVTKGEDVILSSTNASLPEGIDTVQKLADSLQDMAFNSGDQLLYMGEGEELSDTFAISEIDDTNVSVATTYSSQKINELLDTLKAELRAEFTTP